MAGTANESNEAMPEEVKTGADRLLELVKKSKEIATAAAAKELGASVQTVEAWADFLEEDGLVTIKYKFTTPYIAIPEAPKSQQRGQEVGSAALPSESAEFAQLKTELNGMQDILLKAKDEQAAGEFGVLRQTYAALLDKVRAAHDVLVTQAEIAPQKKVTLNELVRSLDEQLQEAAAHASEGLFDDASSSYSKLYGQAQLAIGELSKLYDQITMLQSIQATKNYKDLLGKAYELMQEGKVEEANDLYEKLSFAHQNLAKEFIEKKRQMEDDLVKLNKDLAKSFEQLNLEKLKKARERITLLLDVGNKLLRKGELGTAEPYYLAIKHEYDTLPPGFIGEKKEMQEKVLAFYSDLAKQREKAIRQEFDRAERRIGALVKQIQEMLKDYRVEPAVQMYRQVKQIYGSLPAGFLKEKSALQERIVPLHTAITSIYTQESVNTLKTKSAEIATMLSAMNTHTARGELKEAAAAYETLKQLYRKMPKGFLHEETTLQDEIVQAYEAYLRKARHMETSSSSSTISSIARFLEEAEGQVKRKEFDSANKTYAKIMALYSTIPSGLVAQKARIRENILRLYKILLAAAPAIQIPYPRSLQVSPEKAAPQLHRITSEVTPMYAREKEIAQAPVQETKEVPMGGLPWPARKADGEQAAEEAGNYGDESTENMGHEIDDIERKIEELKGVSKATVKFPNQ